MYKGLRPECKACRKIATRKDYLKRKPKINEYGRAYQERNKEQVRKAQKLWRKRNRESIREKKAAYHRANPSRYVERNRLKRAVNPELANSYSRKWRLTHPEQRKVSLANNKLKRCKVKGACSSEQWIAKCKYHGWRCYLCATPLTAKATHMEHRKPLSRGGSHWPANLAPACQRCNLSKNNKTETEYRALLNRLEEVTQLIPRCS